MMMMMHFNMNDENRETLNVKRKLSNGNLKQSVAQAIKQIDAPTMTMTTINTSTNTVDKDPATVNAMEYLKFRLKNMNGDEEDEDHNIEDAGTKNLKKLQRTAKEFRLCGEIFNQVIQIVQYVPIPNLELRKDASFAFEPTKDALIEIFLSYNPKWLQLGLNTVTETIVSFETMNPGTNVIITAADTQRIRRRVLSQHMREHLFKAADVDALFQNSRKGSYEENPEYRESKNSKILRKILMLVLFLDLAKSSQQFPYHGPLFVPSNKSNSMKLKSLEIKTSERVLREISRILIGEADFIGMLARYKYNVSVVQTWRDEYQFDADAIEVSLRDGLALTRLIETINPDVHLEKIRKPVDRSIKLSNCKTVLEFLRDEGGLTLEVGNSGKITSRNLLEGDKKKTLALVKAIIARYDIKVEKESLAKEVDRIKGFLSANATLTYQISLDRAELVELSGDDRYSCAITEDERDLLAWCQAICSMYSLIVSDFSVSFASGRAFCLIVSHYLPNLIQRDSIKPGLSQYMETSYEAEHEDSLSWSEAEKLGISREEYQAGLEDEKHNFQILSDACKVLGGIPNILTLSSSEYLPDKVYSIAFLAFLSTRLLDSRQEVRAAQKIRTCWAIHRLRSAKKGTQQYERARELARAEWRSRLEELQLMEEARLDREENTPKLMQRKRLVLEKNQASRSNNNHRTLSNLSINNNNNNNKNNNNSTSNDSLVLAESKKKKEVVDGLKNQPRAPSAFELERQRREKLRREARAARKSAGPFAHYRDLEQGFVFASPPTMKRKNSAPVLTFSPGLNHHHIENDDDHGYGKERNNSTSASTLEFQDEEYDMDEEIVHEKKELAAEEVIQSKVRTFLKSRPEMDSSSSSPSPVSSRQSISMTSSSNEVGGSLQHNQSRNSVSTLGRDEVNSSNNSSSGRMELISQNPNSIQSRIERVLSHPRPSKIILSELEDIVNSPQIDVQEVTILILSNGFLDFLERIVHQQHHHLHNPQIVEEEAILVKGLELLIHMLKQCNVEEFPALVLQNLRLIVIDVLDIFLCEVVFFIPATEILRLLPRIRLKEIESIKNIIKDRMQIISVMRSHDIYCEDAEDIRKCYEKLEEASPNYYYY